MWVLHLKENVTIQVKIHLKAIASGVLLFQEKNLNLFSRYIFLCIAVFNL